MAIILQIPEGEFCLGCMFLNIEYNYLHRNDEVKCNLFNTKLYTNIFPKDGKILPHTVEKCEECPES